MELQHDGELLGGQWVSLVRWSLALWIMVSMPMMVGSLTMVGMSLALGESLALVLQQQCDMSRRLGRNHGELWKLWMHLTVHCTPLALIVGRQHLQILLIVGHRDHGWWCGPIDVVLGRQWDELGLGEIIRIHGEYSRKRTDLKLIM